MAYSPGAEIMASGGKRHRRYAIAEIPADIRDLLAGCTKVVKTSSAAVGATGTVYAVAVFPISGGVWVGLDDSADNSGADFFAHNFSPLIGPEIYILCDNEGKAASTDIYIEVNTDGEPVVVYYK